MAETDDDVRPLGAGGRLSPVALARVAAKVIGIVTPAIVGALLAYRSAAGDAELRVQGTKDKAEAGYQVTKEAMQAMEHRLAELEQLVRQLAGQQHPPARRGSRPRAPAPVPPAPPPPRQLPLDLDQAQRQVYRGARPQAGEPPAPAPRGDAAP